jgi:hypothetical protein
MNLRLTDGMLRFLQEHERPAPNAPAEYCVAVVDAKGNLVTPDKRAPISTDKGVFILDGELSHHERSGGGRGKGPYFFSLRLRDEKEPNRPLGRWSGMANSLMLLSANVQGYTDLNREGLIGEMGERVTATLLTATGAPSLEERNRLLDALAREGEKGERVTADVLPRFRGPDNPASLPSGSAFQIRIVSHLNAHIYVAERRPKALRLLLINGSNEAGFTANKQRILPEISGIEVGKVEKREEREYFVFARSLNAPGQPPSVAHLGAESVAPITASLVEDEEHPVRVRSEEGNIIPLASEEIGLIRMLRAAQSAPAGTWAVKRMHFAVTP